MNAWGTFHDFCYTSCPHLVLEILAKSHGKLARCSPQRLEAVLYCGSYMVTSIEEYEEWRRFEKIIRPDGTMS